MRCRPFSFSPPEPSMGPNPHSKNPFTNSEHAVPFAFLLSQRPPNFPFLHAQISSTASIVPLEGPSTPPSSHSFFPMPSPSLSLLFFLIFFTQVELRFTKISVPFSLPQIMVTFRFRVFPLLSFPSSLRFFFFCFFCV